MILGLGKTMEEIASSLTHGDINKKTIIQFIYRDYYFMGTLNPSIEAHQNGKREDKDITEVRHDAWMLRKEKQSYQALKDGQTKASTPRVMLHLEKSQINDYKRPQQISNQWE